MPPRGSAGRPTSPGSSAAATIRWPGSSATPTGSSRVHVKDIAPAGENEDEDGWADVGHGMLDWARALAALGRGAGARSVVVEHDKPTDAARFARAQLRLPCSSCRSRPHERTLRVGIIGCGVISDTYLPGPASSRASRSWPAPTSTRSAPQAQASRYGVKALDPRRAARDPDIDLVINLTPPTAHAAVGQAVLAAGKHVYAEKPLGVTLEEGRELVAAAAAAGRRIGCAPDTFLGGGHQNARRAGRSGRRSAGPSPAPSPS